MNELKKPEIHIRQFVQYKDYLILKEKPIRVKKERDRWKQSSDSWREECLAAWKKET